MGNCTATLRFNVNNYYTEKNKNDNEIELSIPDVTNASEIDLDHVVERVLNLDSSTRNHIMNMLNYLRSTPISKKDIETHHFLSNRTLDELAKMVGMSENDFAHVTESYNIIYANETTINYRDRTGRIITGDGREVYILKSFEDVKKFLNYVKRKEIIRKEAEKPNANWVLKNQDLVKELDEYLQIYNETNKKKATRADLLINFLNNRDHYQIKVVNGKIYNPRKLLGNVIALIDGTYNTDEKYTEFELGLMSFNKNRDEDSFDWKIEIKNFYDTMISYLPVLAETYSYERFKSLSPEELYIFAKKNFTGHPKLEGARLSFEGEIKDGEILTEVTTKKIAAGRIWNFLAEDNDNWSEFRDRACSANKDLEEYRDLEYADFKKLPIEKQLKFFEASSLEIDGQIIKAEKREVNSRTPKTAKEKKEGIYFSTKIEKEKIEDSTKAQIIVKFPYDKVGNIYDISYNTTEVFTPVHETSEESENPVENGMYNGMFIYKKIEDNKTVYIVSRHAISPQTHVSAFASLKAAKNYAENFHKNNSIYSESLAQAHSETNKQITLQNSNLVEGQIVSVLDYTVDFKNLNFHPQGIRDIFRMSVRHFQRFVTENLKSDSLKKRLAGLNTAEQIYLFLADCENKGLIPQNAENSLKVLEELDTIFSSKRSKTDNDDISKKDKRDLIFNIINDIKKAPIVNYYVGKVYQNQYVSKVSNDEEEKGAKGKKDSLQGRLYRISKEDTSIDENVSKASESTFIGQTLDKCKEHLENDYGVTIQVMTNDEIREHARKHNLKIEHELDSGRIKAFIQTINGTPTIVLNKTTATAKDLYHETAHLLLGILQVKDNQKYMNVLKSYENNNTFKSYYKFFLSLYKNMANQDIQEEAVAETIARELAENRGIVNTGDSVIDDILSNIEHSYRENTTKAGENGLGFDTIKDDLKNADYIKSARVKRAISHYIETEIRENNIKEKCD